MDSDHRWLDELNPAQREAVMARDAALLIVAGAGTGKTKTLACRVAWLIQQGVAPQRILLLTFTRRAAAEMLRRAAHLAGEKHAQQVWGGTFHAIANRLLRVYSASLGMSPDFTVMDQSDAADLMNMIRSDLGLGRRDRRFPRKDTLLGIYSRMVNAQEPLEQVLSERFPWCTADAESLSGVFTEYVARKQRQRVLDYDDLLMFWLALCQSSSAGDTVAQRFDHLLVDEYQDTNLLQSAILRGMRRKGRSITAVGDDAQSIYSFRAATVRNILDFPDHFPGTRIVALEQNYRSTQPILMAANTVIGEAKEGYGKELRSDRTSGQRPILMHVYDEAAQAETVCRTVLTHLELGMPLRQQAVLFRTSHHSAMLEVELARRNIPFHKYGGLKFIESAHVKDMLALLRVLENPFDAISWFRLLQLVEGIGPRSAQRIMEDIGVTAAPGSEAEGDRSPLTRFVLARPAAPPASREALDQLRSALGDCAGAPGSEQEEDRAEPRERAASARVAPPLTGQVARLRVFYEPVLQRLHDNAVARLKDIEQLEHIAAGYRSRERFITDLTLDPPNATSDFAGPPHLDDDYLTLSTIHSAKGCEWTAVHIIHAADGMIPSDMALSDEAGVEEERRLLYVAMTRAKDWLYVYFPQRFHKNRFGTDGWNGMAQLSRFLDRAAKLHFEHRVVAHSDAADERAPTSSTEDIYNQLSRLWSRG